TAEITAEDLEVEDPGMLPTSPFYFLKNWTRGIRRVVTLDPTKKAELELEIINQQAAEIKKVEEIAPDRISSISKAIGNYQNNVERLKTRLEAIGETSQNPNIDKMMDKLVDRSIKHQELFDGLKQKFEGREDLIQGLESAGQAVGNVMAVVPRQFDRPEAFQERLERVIEKRPDNLFKELRATEIIDRMDDNLTEEQKEAVQKTKDAFMEKFEERINALKESDKISVLSSEILNRLPGDEFHRMKIFEEMGQGTDSASFRKRIEAVGDKMETSVENLTKEKVEATINEAASAISKLEEKIAASSAVPEYRLKIAKDHLVKAKANLDEAKQKNSTENWREAFGKATSALVIANNGLRALIEKQIMPMMPNGATTSLPTGTGVTNEDGRVCIQVITPAVSPDGVCKEFPTPCDVPTGWKRIDACRNAIEPNENINSGEGNDGIESLREGIKSILNY
ncbi:MAG: DUF5667 domain-containing protein, partial [Patescibacteria group bacterium]